MSSGTACGTDQGFWTPPRVTMLILMLADHRSYTQIAAALHCTKGQVAGKAFRLREAGRIP